MTASSKMDPPEWDLTTPVEPMSIDDLRAWIGFLQTALVKAETELFERLRAEAGEVR
jgi:hypothetical protein